MRQASGGVCNRHVYAQTREEAEGQGIVDSAEALTDQKMIGMTLRSKANCGK